MQSSKHWILAEVGRSCLTPQSSIIGSRQPEFKSWLCSQFNTLINWMLKKLSEDLNSIKKI